MEVRISSLIALLLAAVLGGCSVGEYGSTTMTDASMSAGGEASFNANVKPVVERCVGCHGGGQPPNLANYSLLQPKYKMKPASSNPLITKGDHAGITYLNAADKMKVQTWIESL